MVNEFRPYPKTEQLKSHKKKEKDTPKYKAKKPKKKKNPYLYRGRIIPSRKERTRITKEDYNRMIEEFGGYCMMCGYTPIAAHHIVFRSQFGCGNWRNLAPLCEKCHTRAHKQREFADLIRDMRTERFGPHFAKDKYTLFKEGLIPNTEDKTYEFFMCREEVKRTNTH